MSTFFPFFFGFFFRVFLCLGLTIGQKGTTVTDVGEQAIRQKGKAMETTLTLKAVTASVATEATTLVNRYRETNGSNRTNWLRVAGVLAGVLTVIKTGDSVEITDLIGATDEKTNKTNGSPAYHLAHRILSGGAIRPHWQNVQIVTLRNGTITQKKNIVTGDSTTTGKVGTVRVFIVPTA